MPSKGTSKHKDNGEQRAEVVISDQHGKTCSEKLKDLVIKAYEEAGFEVAYNWPYIGGRIVGSYGHPENNVESIQVELNRSLYMDESTKLLSPDDAKITQEKLTKAITQIYNNL